ncbi:hypothetical protein LUZ60_010576 [Juncus effusus]|nr:hypothetical protein LUZ60_010576 [Juncus effusus]
MREALVLLSPAMSPLKGSEEAGAVPAGEDRWRFPNGGAEAGSTVNAVSFGFVATAILISMFLFMAIFEHFLRPRGEEEITPASRRRRFWWWGRRDQGADLEANKLCFPTVEMPVYAKEVSVLMPGQDVPTHIAHPMPPPVPSPPEKLSIHPINLNPSSSSSNPNVT